jgi:hypothetical protein
MLADIAFQIRSELLPINSRLFRSYVWSLTTADGFAEREAAKTMIDDARQAADNPHAEITLGADKGYDAKEFHRRFPRDERHPACRAKHPGAPLRGAGCNRCQLPAVPMTENPRPLVLDCPKIRDKHGRGD